MRTETPNEGFLFLALQKHTSHMKYFQINRSYASQKFFDYDAFFRKKIQERKDSNMYRVFKIVHRQATTFPEASELSHGKQRVIVWCTNDVLGMTCHPTVIAATLNFMQKHGVGSAGARGICGNSPQHVTLERELAAFHSKEAAILSTSGFLTNVSAIPLLVKILPDCEVYSASNNHASLIEGISNSRVKKNIFECDQPAQLEHLLRQAEPMNKPKLIVFESIYSMTGIKSDIRKLCSIGRKYGAMNYVDEVHAVGLYGSTGSGMAQLRNVEDKVDVLVGSLAKAFGNTGAYLAGSESLIDVIRSYAPGFVFTTAIAPMTLAGSLAALRIIQSEEGLEMRQKHQHNVNYMKKQLLAAGLPVELNDSHIILVLIGDPALCTRMADELTHVKGHYVTGVNYPTVPRGHEKLRITPTPFHTEEMINSLVSAMVELWDKLGLHDFQLQQPKL